MVIMVAFNGMTLHGAWSPYKRKTLYASELVIYQMLRISDICNGKVPSIGVRTLPDGWLFIEAKLL